jgi:hypothetical protein
LRRLLAWVVVASPLVLGSVATAAVASPSVPQGDQIFRFQDPAIVEASALVAQDGLFLTTNDSGDTGRVFAVDRTGQTVGVTHWSDDPRDAEALAPGGPGHVWVGDIGDNDADRATIEIARVPVGRGDRTIVPTTYRLTYPDGPVNAETLVRDPTTGRLYIATKTVLDGELYAVPEHLDPFGNNVLQPVGKVLPIATDGAFFPDGRHLLVRGYTSAVVYDWPSMREDGSFALPHERQGEGIAIADDGEIYVSSEGARTPVLRVTLPPDLAKAVQARPTSPTSATSSPSTSPTPGTSSPAVDDGGSPDLWPWLAGGLLAVAALVVLVRALRPR